MAIAGIMYALLTFYAGTIISQIFLSKKAKWLGLILPIITFCISLFFVLDISENRLSTFMLFNIPTVLLIGIYVAGYRAKRNRQRELDKMSIQDLK